jgi:hypothetical protein
MHVVRYVKVFQIALYYFGIRNYRINEAGTNKIEWKRAKKYVNSSFFNYISYVNPVGPKPLVPPVY